MDFRSVPEGVGTTLKYLFSDEPTAKAFVRAVTLQYETPTMRNHHVVYVIAVDEQIRPVFEMVHSFGGWPE